MRAHPAEGPTGCTVIGADGLQLVAELFGHLAKGTTTQRLHDDTLHTRLLTLVIQVLSIGILTPAIPHRRMSPVEEVHLNLNKIEMVLLLMVEQPVKRTYIAMIRETQMTNTTCLALLQ